MSISPKAVILSGVVNYEVRIGIDEPSGLRPDMTTNVLLPTESKRGLAVPSPAVRREDGARYVLVKQDEAFAKRPVRTGSRDERYVEIVEGLREGEVVATGDVPLALVRGEEKR